MCIRDSVAVTHNPGVEKDKIIGIFVLKASSRLYLYKFSLGFTSVHSSFISFSFKEGVFINEIFSPTDKVLDFSLTSITPLALLFLY